MVEDSQDFLLVTNTWTLVRVQFQPSHLANLKAEVSQFMTTIPLSCFNHNITHLWFSVLGQNIPFSPGHVLKPDWTEKIDRAFFNWVSKMILYCFGFALLWSCTTISTNQTVTKESIANPDLVTRVFSRLNQAVCFYFKFSLVSWWRKPLLWVVVVTNLVLVFWNLISWKLLYMRWTL